MIDSRIECCRALMSTILEFAKQIKGVVFFAMDVQHFVHQFSVIFGVANVAWIGRGTVTI